MSRLSELINNPSVAITVSLDDLRQICKELIDEGKRQSEEDVKRQSEEDVKRDEPEIYTADQVANKLSVTKTTLWRWHEIDYLNYIQVGRKRVYPKRIIDKMLSGY